MEGWRDGGGVGIVGLGSYDTLLMRIPRLHLFPHLHLGSYLKLEETLLGVVSLSYYDAIIGGRNVDINPNTDNLLGTNFWFMVFDSDPYLEP